MSYGNGSFNYNTLLKLKQKMFRRQYSSVNLFFPKIIPYDLH